MRLGGMDQEGFDCTSIKISECTFLVNLQITILSLLVQNLGLRCALHNSMKPNFFLKPNK